MLELQIYPPGFGEVTGSPFATKALCLLELAGLDYTTKVTPDPRRAPKKKLPVLHDDDMVIPDSDQIRDHLETNYKADFDKGLSASEKAVSRSIVRMVEEHLYFAIVSTRWQQESNWPVTRDEFFVGLPRFLKNFISGSVRKGVLAQLHGQGMGRFSETEQLARVRKDIAAVETLLGAQDFLFGDTPTAADASVVPMLRAVAFYPNPNPLSDLVLQNPRLIAYIERGKDRFYPK